MPAIVENNLNTDLIKQVIDNLPSAIVVLTTDTSIVLSNRVAEYLSNKTKAQLAGLQGGEAFGCIHANDVPEGCGHGYFCKECIIRNTIAETIRTGKNQSNVEAVLTFRDNGTKVLSISTTWMEKPELVIVSVSDITNVKQQEEIRLENTKLQVALDTGAAVCHEMNQPLTVISGYIDLLLMGVENPDEVEEYMHEIKEHAVKLAKITEKLMLFNHYQEMKYLSGTILDIDGSST